MSETEVTREGQHGIRPGSQAVSGSSADRRWGRRRRGEQPVVPRAEFTSYYGQPVINAPVWRSPDIPGYLFLGGLAGASSLLGAGAQLTGRPSLARTAKAGAFGAGCLSMAALLHDLGRPARFLHMLRVFKVSSPMNVGSWLLGAYVPATGVAAASALTGRVLRLGAAATAGAARLELAGSHRMTQRIGMVAEPYHCGRAGMYMKAGEALTVLGMAGALAARRGRAVGALSGAALLAASAATRWGVFHAGLASAGDPRYTVAPQRERLRRRLPATAAEAPR